MSEIVRVVFENEKIKVEEIVSNGVVSPVGFWYDNPIDEWVSVTVGGAVLQFETGETALKAGES